MKDETAVKRRKIRFGVLFAGLGFLSIVFLFMLGRFLLLLIPVAEERTTLQAQPIVTIETQQLTENREQGTGSREQLTPQPSSLITQSPTPGNQQSTINNQQLTINEEPTPLPPSLPTPSLQSPISNLQSPTATPQPPAPAQLIIPSLGVSKILDYIPVENGQWNLEELESGVGHLQTTGEYPGDAVGMTFIGHVTRPWPEIAGPFADLIFMKPGDEIIYRWDGFDYVYGFESFLRVKPELVESLYVEDGDVITLATCDTWDYVEWGYADRLLARARLLRKVPTPQETPILQ